MSGRSPRALGWIDSEIPLRRYFLCVGGALLTLLFTADALMPRPPANENIGSSPKLPRIPQTTQTQLYVDLQVSGASA
jgi:hypothetical protein